MDDKIYQCQQRLFYKLFATLPSTREVNNFTEGLDLDFNIKSFYFFRNKDFWFTRVEKNDKFYFLFGLRNKNIHDISGKDICLIIDFDKNIQFNDVCLGLFSIKNSDIHVFINCNILKERYPSINVSDFIKRNFKSFDGSIDMEVIDLGGLNFGFIENIEKLVKLASKVKSQNIAASEKLEENTGICKSCSKQINNFSSDLDLADLRTLRPELCEKCIEKIVASEFYTKILPLLNGNNADEINLAKKKFGNDKLFDIGLKLLKKYEIIKFIGVKNLFYTIDKDSYIVKKYMKYSDSNNLLIDNISKINEENKVSEGKSGTIDVKKNFNSESSIKKEIEDYEKNEINRTVFLEHFKAGKTKEESAERAHIKLSIIEEWYEKGSNNKQPYVDFYNKYVEVENNKKSPIPHVIKTDSFGNKNIVSKMNAILEDLVNGQTEDEAIAHANISKNTYDYWITRGKHDFGDLYVQFYNYTKEIKSKNHDSEVSESLIGQDVTLPTGIYEPLLPEYESLFTSMNQSGIAWVNEIDGMWSYSRNIGGKKINIIANNIPELYDKVNNQNLIWGIRDYDRAKKFIDFPEDFEIPNLDLGEDLVNEDLGIYARLPEEYEKSFNSMNKTGIAWVNQIGSKLYYTKTFNGKNIRLVGKDIYELYDNVKKENHIWGIRDYDKAKEFIDFPDDFEIPEEPKIEDVDDKSIDTVDPDIYAPLPEKFEESFAHTSMNKTGIAWVNHIGKKWIYAKNINGKPFKIDDSDIYGLHRKVKKANHVWGIRDYSIASKYIDIPKDFVIPKKPADSKKTENSSNSDVKKSIFDPLSKNDLSKFNPNPNNKTGIAWVNKVGNNWVYQRQKNGKKLRIEDSNIVKLYEKVVNNNQIWGITDIDKARIVIETNSIPISVPKKIEKPSISRSQVTVNYIEKSVNEFEILIKGVINNKDLFNVLNRFDSFKENIKRVVITSINKQSDIFIELELNKYSLRSFEEKLEDLGWKINK